MEYKYKISIIIPIYNSQDYLDDVINSVIDQTIGFQNIQLILVNDGSKDNSEDICLKYKNTYANIVYIKKENGGVSSARNEGMKYVEGKYINFIDSDDKWDKEALLHMYNFMEENYFEIDFVSARIKCFEASEDYHFLDYKFEKTRVIDIEKEPEMLIFHVASSLFKSEVIKDMRFDTRLKIGEDCVFINMILLNRLKYGVVREALYNYRKRNTGNSAIQGISRNRSWYFDTPSYSWKKLIDESNKKYDEVIKYIQYVLLYELKWRINCNYINLNYFEVEKHLEIISETAKYIDYDIIKTYRLFDNSEKETLIKIKDEIR
ncbi:MAG: glycosyltransferase family 2 protein [Clostridia bacterium]|jgi:glycosyltransferase involved in cell wall biosynthesis|nr:glycosyltransferase family 2 protein [Clostridia bacterium]